MKHERGSLSQRKITPISIKENQAIPHLTLLQADTYAGNFWPSSDLQVGFYAEIFFAWHKIFLMTLLARIFDFL